MTKYEVYIDFGNNINADNPLEAKKKAIKMIERDQVHLIRVIEKDERLLVHEVIDGRTTVEWEEEK